MTYSKIQRRSADSWSIKYCSRTRSPRISKETCPLDDRWKVGYKRQMDMYVWIMPRKDTTFLTLDTSCMWTRNM